MKHSECSGLYWFILVILWTFYNLIVVVCLFSIRQMWQLVSTFSQSTASKHIWDKLMSANVKPKKVFKPSPFTYSIILYDLQWGWHTGWLGVRREGMKMKIGIKTSTRENSKFAKSIKFMLITEKLKKVVPRSF